MNARSLCAATLARRVFAARAWGILLIAGVLAAPAHGAKTSPAAATVRVAVVPVEELKLPAPETRSSPAVDGAKAATDSPGVAEEGAATECSSELWLVSTRNLPAAGNCCTPQFDPCVFRHECGRGYYRSTLDELLADDDPRRVTMIFVHGNDTDADYARQYGAQLYAEMRRGCCGTPVRLIVWSWPSDQVTACIRRDVQIKACRTNIEGYFLASFVDQLPAQTPLSLAGYSYGARVVTGSLHLLGGGTLTGRQLSEREHPERESTRAILLAAAMANNWLEPGMTHEFAITQVERLANLINPSDRVLRFYPRLWGRGGPEALGVTGVSNPARLGDDRPKLAQFDIGQAVHRRHSWDNFVESPQVMGILRNEITQQAGATAAPISKPEIAR